MVGETWQETENTKCGFGRLMF